MKLTYDGPTAIDLPAAGIVGWRPGEARDVPDELVESLLERGDFAREQARARKMRTDQEGT